MARLNCKCGHRTHLTGHSEHEFYLLSTNYLDELTERSDKKLLTGDELNTAIVDGTQETSRCEKCSRLYIYDLEQSKLVVRVYNLEETLRDEEANETEK